MVNVPISLGQTEVYLIARGRAYTIPPILQGVPGGLYPMYSASFEVDEYRLKAGWPTPVPDGDIVVDCLVSAEGMVLGNRQAPTSIVTDADMRWIADSNYYDVVSLRWSPIQSDVSPWETSADHAPTLITDYEYAVGMEKFNGMTALNFDSNTQDYMWINLSLAMGGTSGYTVIMVLCPNSIYGNDTGAASNGLWGPWENPELEDNGVTHKPPEGHWELFTVKSKAVYVTSDSSPEQTGVSIGDALTSTAPSMLAMVISKPQTTLYASLSNGQVNSKSITCGPTLESLNTKFWLGNGPYSTIATMDMALLDLGIYGSLLTKSQVAAEFAKLSQVYGV